MSLRCDSIWVLGVVCDGQRPRRLRHEYWLLGCRNKKLFCVSSSYNCKVHCTNTTFWFNLNILVTNVYHSQRASSLSRTPTVSINMFVDRDPFPSVIACTATTQFSFLFFDMYLVDFRTTFTEFLGILMDSVITSNYTVFLVS